MATLLPHIPSLPRLAFTVLALVLLAQPCGGEEGALTEAKGDADLIVSTEAASQLVEEDSLTAAAAAAADSSLAHDAGVADELVEEAADFAEDDTVDFVYRFSPRRRAIRSFRMSPRRRAVFVSPRRRAPSPSISTLGPRRRSVFFSPRRRAPSPSTSRVTLGPRRRNSPAFRRRRTVGAFTTTTSPLSHDPRYNQPYDNRRDDRYSDDDRYDYPYPGSQPQSFGTSISKVLIVMIVMSGVVCICCIQIVMGRELPQGSSEPFLQVQ
eukprot:TRINITY_DN4653_c0_g1_i1.p1 TRINITY_DN4653_c0_g1~~TRINITY_DN4653_c0_g1_i1.p1  ORF type:complete len:267 (-),score=24.47 TRINITY_DN4653_c0_g1_i1:119-919(-)